MGSRYSILEAIAKRAKDPAKFLEMEVGGTTARQVLKERAPELLGRVPRSTPAAPIRPFNVTNLMRELEQKGARMDVEGDTFKLLWHDGGEEVFKRPDELYAKVSAKAVPVRPKEKVFDLDEEISRRLSTPTEEDAIAAARGEPNLAGGINVPEAFKSGALPSPAKLMEPPMRPPGGGHAGKSGIYNGDPIGHPLGPPGWAESGWIGARHYIQPTMYWADGVEKASKGAIKAYSEVVAPFEQQLRFSDLGRLKWGKAADKIMKGVNDEDRRMALLWLKAPSDGTRRAIEEASGARPELFAKAQTLESAAISMVDEASGGLHKLERWPVIRYQGKQDGASFLPLPEGERKAWGFLGDALDGPVPPAQSLQEVSDALHAFHGLTYLTMNEAHVAPMYRTLIKKVDALVPGTKSQRIWPEDVVQPLLSFLNRGRYNPEWFERAVRRAARSSKWARRLYGGQDPIMLSMSMGYGHMLGFRLKQPLVNYLMVTNHLIPEQGEAAVMRALADLGTKSGRASAQEQASRLGYLHGKMAPVFGTEEMDVLREASRGGWRKYHEIIRASLRPLGWTDDHVRYLSLRTAYLKVMREATSLMNSRQTLGDVRRFMIRSGLGRQSDGLKRYASEPVMRGIRDGDMALVREGAERAGVAAQDMIVGLYRQETRPGAFNAPFFGRAFGMFGNFPANASNFFITRLTNGRAIDRGAFLARWLLYNTVPYYALEKVAGIDVSRYFFFSPYSFAGGYIFDSVRDLMVAMDGGPEADRAKYRLKRLAALPVPGGALGYDLYRSYEAFSQGKGWQGAIRAAGFRPEETVWAKGRSVRKPRVERKR